MIKEHIEKITSEVNRKLSVPLGEVVTAVKYTRMAEFGYSIAEAHYKNLLEKMAEGLNLAQAEIRAMYKRVGINGSNVLDNCDSLLTEYETFKTNNDGK